jgi:preprotein translocase subunit SecD
VEGTGEALYLAPEVVLTNADVRRSRPQVTSVGGNGITVELTDEGGEKLARLTREDLNKRVAILLDGRLVMAPIIRSEIPGGVALIEGDFTKKEARDLASGIQASRQ